MSRAAALRLSTKGGQGAASSALSARSFGPNFVPESNTQEARWERASQRPLDDHSRRCQMLKLPDGRKLGYAFFGSVSRNAKVAVYNHGQPGTRLEAAMLHTICIKKLIKLVAIDRPGIGLSSAPRWWKWGNGGIGRTVKSWADDVRYLLDHAPNVFPNGNNVPQREYYIIGVSGGAPYTFACALNLPRAHRILGIALISGATPYDKLPAFQNTNQNIQSPRFDFMNVGTAADGLYLDMTVGRQARQSEERLRKMMDVNLVQDREYAARKQLLWTNNEKQAISTRMAALSNARQVARTPARYFLLDDKLTWDKEWGFTLDDVKAALRGSRVPIRIFHGSQDRRVSADAALQVCEVLPRATILLFARGTHSSMFSNPNHLSMIMTDLLASSPRGYTDKMKVIETM